MDMRPFECLNEIKRIVENNDQEKIKYYAKQCVVRSGWQKPNEQLVPWLYNILLLEDNHCRLYIEGCIDNDGIDTPRLMIRYAFDDTEQLHTTSKEEDYMTEFVKRVLEEAKNNEE